MTKKRNLERQIGCMAGFFHIFDRPNSLSGRQLCSAKYLPPTQVAGSLRVSQSSMEVLTELEKEHPGKSTTSPQFLKECSATEQGLKVSDEESTLSNNPNSQPLKVPTFEFHERTNTPWRFSKETPRLSLDSRAIVDGCGSIKRAGTRADTSLAVKESGTMKDVAVKQRHSTSVVVRLMGLDSLPSVDAEFEKKAELRRSASESRARRDKYERAESTILPLQKLADQQDNSSRYDGGNQDDYNSGNGKEIKEFTRGLSYGVLDPWESARRNVRTEAELAPTPTRRSSVGRRNFFDSSDFFPELMRNSCVDEETERMLKMRNDFKSSTQLVTTTPPREHLHPNQFYSTKSRRKGLRVQDLGFSEPRVISMKPFGSEVKNGCNRNDLPPSGCTQQDSRRRDRAVAERRGQKGETCNVSSFKSENRVRSPTQMRGQMQLDQSRTSPVQPLGIGSRRRLGTDLQARRATLSVREAAKNHGKEEGLLIPSGDEISVISDNNVGDCSSSVNSEASKSEVKREGMSLLERCNKLLRSIEEMNERATELQKSPNSVLDSSFYKEESSPSPITKKCIEFREQFIESEDEVLSSELSSVESVSDDRDFPNFAGIIQALNCLPGGSDLCLLLQKQQALNGRRRRVVTKVILDMVREILDQKSLLPPWKLASLSYSTRVRESLHQIKAELKKLETNKDNPEAEDLCKVICTALWKDFAEDGIRGWKDYYVETSDSVLNIERLIFKDLVGETIQDISAHSGGSRRRLVF